jgi:hypothetical protein
MKKRTHKIVFIYLYIFLYIYIGFGGGRGDSDWPAPPPPVTYTAVPALTSGNVLGSRQRVNHSQTFRENRCQHDLEKRTDQLVTVRTVVTCPRGLVVRVLGYRYRGPGSIPGTTRKKT